MKNKIIKILKSHKWNIGQKAPKEEMKCAELYNAMLNDVIEDVKNIVIKSKKKTSNQVDTSGSHCGYHPTKKQHDKEMRDFTKFLDKLDKKKKK